MLVNFFNIVVPVPGVVDRDECLNDLDISMNQTKMYYSVTLQGFEV